MSSAKVCDNCGAVLVLDERGDDENGDIAAWIVVTAVRQDLDACSRSCATELLADGSPLHHAIDAQLEVITEIARTIREGRSDDDAED